MSTINVWHFCVAFQFFSNFLKLCSKEPTWLWYIYDNAFSLLRLLEGFFDNDGLETASEVLVTMHVPVMHWYSQPNTLFLHLKLNKTFFRCLMLMSSKNCLAAFSQTTDNTKTFIEEISELEQWRSTQLQLFTEELGDRKGEARDALSYP